MRKSSILVVHGSDTLRGALERVLANEGHDVDRSSADESDLSIAAARRPSIVLVEADAGCENVLEPLRALLNGEAPTLVVTSSASEEALARRLGAVETFCKPFAVEDLLAAIDRHARPENDHDDELRAAS